MKQIREAARDIEVICETDVLVQEAGVQPMLHSQFVAPIMEGSTISGVITESKSGREAILAKRIIDATGDADVAALAGAPYSKTPKEKMMAASVMFSMAGVDKKIHRAHQGGFANL